MYPWTGAHQVSLSKRFPRQEYWSVLGGTVQNSLEGEGPWGNGEGPEVPRHCVQIAEKHFLPLGMHGAKI